MTSTVPSRMGNKRFQRLLVIGFMLWPLWWAGVHGAGGGPTPPNDSQITANVLGYALLNSRVEDIQPEQVLHSLWVEILRSDDVSGLPNFTRQHVGRIIRLLTKEGLSPLLFGKTIQAHVQYVGDEHGGRFWVRDISIR